MQKKVTVKITKIDKSPFKHDEVLFYEVWQPETKHVYLVTTPLFRSFYLKDALLLPFTFENFGCVYHPRLLKATEADAELCWVDDTLRIPLKRRPHVCEFDVLCMIRTYTLAPSKDQAGLPKKEWTYIRHCSDVAVFMGDSGSVVRYSRALGEAKYNGGEADHECFHFDVTGVPTQPNYQKDLVEHWERQYRVIWDKFIRQEMNFLTTRSVVPISFVVNGPPIAQAYKDKRITEDLLENKRFGEKILYDVYKGLPDQHLYRNRIELSGDSVVTEDWLEEKLNEIVTAHGYTLDWYIEVAREVFNHHSTGKKRYYVNERDFHHLRSFSVRVITIIAETRPYMYDICFNKHGQLFMGDALDTATAIFGDCEDVGSLCFLVAMGILFPLDKGGWKKESIRALQKVIAFIGVPVGIAGRGQSQLKQSVLMKRLLKPENHNVAHAFAALLPVDHLEQTLQIPNQRLKREWCVLFQLQIDAPYWTLFEPHAAILEGTLLSTPFYNPREIEKDESKVKQFDLLLSSLVSVGEDRSIWKNHTVEYPYAYERERGSVVHSKVQRIYFHLPKAVIRGLPPVRVQNQLVPLDIHHSFMVYPKGSTEEEAGIDGLVFFAKTKTIDWELRMSALMTPEVFNAQCYIVREFERPLVPFHAHEPRFCGMDPCKLKHAVSSQYTYSSWKSQLRSLPPIPKDRSKRLFLYCWKLVHSVQTKDERSESPLSKTTKEWLETTVKKLLKFDHYNIVPYGNGFMVILCWK